ncbi:tRNA pseudouridine(38-40) synthase TruA [Bowmanella sp. Y26]|uniref:tRNA pseudouridine(38-40) synthase TruA n=1 Tax=Bowmanella yangjiangensis TaxID=2811230 RepID=UPI001BDD50B0|nr:tRNA pseudouridine(38-40) synthase TruA [Bowmanella yangjiangensis]MBT1062980.1 tRNA pseudouridine(38-40) synthase TruA [Bowmanella yangjiangensis]
MRIALGIEYDGSKYYGWQRQREVNSVQQELETALSRIADQPIELACAGRTDAGVHATGQVVHFDVDNPRAMRAWTLGMNAALPDDIAVKWATQVPDDFHARFSATARRYRYVIYNHPLRSGILRQGVTHYHSELDVARMNSAAQCLLGEHDFSAFRAAICQSKSPFRNVTHVALHRLGDYVVLEIQANAFLHHMVRNITGSLLEIGSGRRHVEWLEALLIGKDRSQAAATAKPNGLYLVDVSYPDEYQLPAVVPGPLFLPVQLG